MIVALVAAVLMLGQGLAVAVLVLDRTHRRAAEERRHLTHIAISRHVGEIRTIETPVAERVERSGYTIEGLS